MIKVIHWIDCDGEAYIVKAGKMIKSYSPSAFIFLLAQPHDVAYAINTVLEDEVPNWDHFDAFVYLAWGAYKSCDQEALETFDFLLEEYTW